MSSAELSESPSRLAVGQAGRILLLEGEDLLREMLALALKEQGYEVVVTSDGRNALPSVQASS